MAEPLDQRSTLVVSIVVAIVAVVLILSIAVGTTLNAAGDKANDRHDSDNLVKCAQTTSCSPAECRVLIYGAR